MSQAIDLNLARRILELVDAGLVQGLGVQEPGKMCIEAAICCAMGLPHSDEPPCVAQEDRAYKIHLNDAFWSSPNARAKGMRRIAVMQLGTDGTSRAEWVRILQELTIRRVLPEALEAAAKSADRKYKAALHEAAKSCRENGTKEAALDVKKVADATYAASYAADAAAYAASYAADAAAYAADATYAASYAADAAAYAADAAADAAAYAAERDRVLTIAARCAEEAYERTGSPGVDILRQIESELRA